MEDKNILTGESLEEAVRSLNLSWAVLPGQGLVRVIPTQDFASGFKVVSLVAQAAEKGHFEPEITLRRNEVEISLPSYMSGGVTSSDIEVANKIDAILQ